MAISFLKPNASNEQYEIDDADLWLYTQEVQETAEIVDGDGLTIPSSLRLTLNSSNPEQYSNDIETEHQLTEVNGVYTYKMKSVISDNGEELMSTFTDAVNLFLDKNNVTSISFDVDAGIGGDINGVSVRGKWTGKLSFSFQIDEPRKSPIAYVSSAWYYGKQDNAINGESLNDLDDAFSGYAARKDIRDDLNTNGYIDPNNSNYSYGISGNIYYDGYTSNHAKYTSTWNGETYSSANGLWEQDFVEVKNNQGIGMEWAFRVDFATVTETKRLNALSISSMTPTITTFLNKNKAEIQETGMIFLMGKSTRDKIKQVTTRAANNDVEVFIDQEWWRVNRYEDVDNASDWDNYNKKSWISTKWNRLSTSTQNAVDGIFTGTKFPSMEDVGDVYRSISGTTEKAEYLDYITYLRLYTLQEVGIMNYGLVCDLDLGNPAISTYGRSFSDDVDEYIELGEAMADNADALWMSIYLKHFPGHGSSSTDTHSGVMDLRQEKSYLVKNMKVFKEIIWNNNHVGLMAGHMIIPRDLRDDFDDICESAAYLYTDDMQMGGYTSATGGDYNNGFFTTDRIIEAHPDKVVMLKCNGVLGVW